MYCLQYPVKNRSSFPAALSTVHCFCPQACVHCLASLKGTGWFSGAFISFVACCRMTIGLYSLHRAKPLRK